MVSPSLPVTLKAIANTVGVHVSTVSRVLNGKVEMAGKAASKETVDRIRALASALDYQPNVQATSLKMRKSMELGVVMPRLSDLVMATIYEGIDEAADEAGYVAFVSNTLDDKARQHARVERALHRQVAGLIIGDTHIGREQPLLEKLRLRRIPHVLVSRRQAGYPSVSCDDVVGGRMAAQHLYELGHRNVAILAGAAHAVTGDDRLRAFTAFYRERGLDLPPERILHSDGFDTLAGRALGERLFSGPAHSRPTAVFAVNDFLAIGLMGAMRDRGLQVGVDIALIGYNDTPLAAQLPIALTSVALPMHQMGRQAVELLLASLAGEPIVPRLLAPTLQIRGSTVGVQRPAIR